MKAKEQRPSRPRTSPAAQEQPYTSGWSWLQSKMAAPVNGSSLAAFRISIGVVMALEAWSLCRPSASSNGRIPLEVFYTGPGVQFHFPYPGFHWLPIMAPNWIEATVALLAIGGVMMAMGLLYRIAAIIVFLSWGYLYAIESTRTYWMSYHYLELLVTFLLIWMPAARRLSFDAWVADHFQKITDARLPLGSQPGRRDSSAGRSIGWTRIFGNANRRRNIPFWTLLLLRGQLVIAYFYAGVAKLNADWLLDAQPVRYYLSQPRWIEDYGSLLSASQLAFFKKLLQSSEA